MTTYRYRMIWTGFQGAPGYSTLYADESAGTAQAFASAVRDMFFTILAPTGTATKLPTDVKISGEPLVDHFDELTGNLQGQTPVTPGGQIVGVDTTRFSSPSGMAITWNTGVFLNGRRVKGRTYMVPLGGSAYQADGSLDNAFLTSAQITASAWVTSNVVPVVWHRPTTPGGQDGSAFNLAAAIIKDKAAVLTSRRD